MTTDESAYAAMMASTEHFFRADALQRWSISNPDKRIRFGTWSSHKWPLKEYIRNFTGDREYAEAKEREPSLRGLAASPREGMGVAIDSHQTFFKQPQDLQLRTAMVAGSVAAYVGIEMDLWDAIDSNGE